MKLDSHSLDKDVLITGGAGFIGGHLAHALLPDTNVTILDDFSTGDPDSVPSDTALIKGDIRNPATVMNAVADVDIVFHQAGLVSVAASIQDPQNSHTRNATGTLNILEAARKHDAKVIIASSAAVYGKPEYTPIDESHPLSPLSPYGLDKLVSDRYVHLYNKLYGLEAISLRYFNVYGPGQTGGNYAGVINIFLEQARSEADITVHGSGTQTRDFVHVQDIIQANIQAALSETSEGSYNIGTGESVNIQELARLIKKSVDSSSEIVFTDSREGDIEQSLADITSARTDLDYEPTIEIQDGIHDLVKNQ